MGQVGGGGENSRESQPQAGNGQEWSDAAAGFIADFDINKTYEPRPEIKDTSLADGAYVQIGDTVLKLGEATLKDFVNAGVDLYYMPDAPRWVMDRRYAD